MPANKFIPLPINRKLLTYIFSRIEIRPEYSFKGVPCWLWTGTIDVGGYGKFQYGGKRVGVKIATAAHRYVYQLFVKEIPPELHDDHLCRVRRCVNPVHGEPVTPLENCMRSDAISAQNARKTHCKRGHELTGYVNANGERQCKVCNNIRNKTQPSYGKFARERSAWLKSLPSGHPEKEKMRIRARDWHRRKYAAETPEERAARNAKRREYLRLKKLKNVNTQDSCSNS